MQRVAKHLYRCGNQFTFRRAIPPYARPAFGGNDPKGLDMLESIQIAPRKFFSMAPLSRNAGRVYVLSGSYTFLQHSSRHCTLACRASGQGQLPSHECLQWLESGHRLLDART